MCKNSEDYNLNYRGECNKIKKILKPSEPRQFAQKIMSQVCLSELIFVKISLARSQSEEMRGIFEPGSEGFT